MPKGTGYKTKSAAKKSTSGGKAIINKAASKKPSMSKGLKASTRKKV